MKYEIINDEENENLNLENINLEEDENNTINEEDSIDVPLSGSPLYPHIFFGESAKPLMNQFNESEYIDDNISRTYLGLMSFYG